LFSTAFVLGEGTLLDLVGDTTQATISFNRTVQRVSLCLKIRYFLVPYGVGTPSVFSLFLHHVGMRGRGRVKQFNDNIVRQDQSILIIDDDVDFCCLLEIAFQEANVSRPIQVVNNGWAAVEHLRKLCGQSAGSVTPGLVLLDLRMPGLNGLEVLRWIRDQPFYNEMPVVVFTGLEAQGDHSEAVSLGATSLRLKPFTYRDLVKEAEILRETYLEDHALKDAA
jgi:CheY-like chemotaxis protein